MAVGSRDHRGNHCMEKMLAFSEAFGMIPSAAYLIMCLCIGLSPSRSILSDLLCKILTLSQGKLSLRLCIGASPKGRGLEIHYMTRS